MTHPILNKISNVFHQLIHEDLFDEPRKSSSKQCKRGKCCCKHHSSHSKKESKHTSKIKYTPPTPKYTHITPNHQPIPTKKPCLSCKKQFIQNTIHHHEHEHQHDHVHEHHEHQHDHDYEHQHHDLGYHHENHEGMVHENQENKNMDEEYRRFYYEVLPQMNIQKTTEPAYQETLENEVDHAIQFSQFD